MLVKEICLENKMLVLVFWHSNFTCLCFVHQAIVGLFKVGTVQQSVCTGLLFVQEIWCTGLLVNSLNGIDVKSLKSSTKI